MFLNIFWELYCSKIGLLRWYVCVVVVGDVKEWLYAQIVQSVGLDRRVVRTGVQIGDLAGDENKEKVIKWGLFS